MKQSKILREKELFPGSQIISQRSFKIIDTRDKSALLAVICPIKSAFSVLIRDKSAFFQKIDCFECQSPHKNTA